MLALCNPRSGAKQLHRAGKFNCSHFGNAMSYSLPLPSRAACVKTDEMIDIFSTPSNSPYLGGESISFCRRQFPSPSIGGRVRDGGRYNLKKPFSHRLRGLVKRVEVGG